jgi:chromosome partitioning protein
MMMARAAGQKRSPIVNHATLRLPTFSAGESGPMNVITLASRKGGVGKSTLTAHLAGFAHLVGYRSMVVDADPQGSLTLWHSMRANGARGVEGLALQNAAQGMNRILASAQLNGYQWVFIDTGGERDEEACALADLAGPYRDRELVELGARQRHRRGFLVLALHRRGVDYHRIGLTQLAGGRNRLSHGGKVEEARADRDQHQRCRADRLLYDEPGGRCGASAGEIDGDSACKTEIARLWSAVERSVEAINLAHAGAGGYRAA